MRSKVTLCFVLLGLVWLMLAQGAVADTTVLDFDSIALTSGQCTTSTAAAAYLSSFGITFSSPTVGAAPQICSGVGTAITAVSGNNWFAGAPPVTNTDLTYTLTFSEPLDSVSWNDAVLATYITYPTWNATAYDGTVAVGSVSQTTGFGTGTTQTFTIDGPGITSLTIASFNSAARTVNDVPIDNLTLVTPTPEPSAMLLFGTGLLGIGFAIRKQLIA